MIFLKGGNKVNDINNKNKPTLPSTKEVDIVSPETSKKTVKKIDKKPVTKVKPPLKEKVEKPAPKITHKAESTIESKKDEIVLTDIASIKKYSNHQLYKILRYDDIANFEKMKKIDENGIQYIKKRTELDIENSNSKISLWMTVFVFILTAILTVLIAITNIVRSENETNSILDIWETLSFMEGLSIFYFLLSVGFLGIALVAYFKINHTSQKLLLLIEEYQLLHK